MTHDLTMTNIATGQINQSNRFDYHDSLTALTSNTDNKVKKLVTVFAGIVPPGQFTIMWLKSRAPNLRFAAT